MIDQIPELGDEKYNALNILGKRINNARGVIEAILRVADFEAGIEKAKEPENREGKTVIDPEITKAKINQAELVRSIQEEMVR